MYLEKTKHRIKITDEAGCQQPRHRSDCKFELLHEKPVRFLTRPDTNWPVGPQKRSTGLQFLIKEEEGLYITAKLICVLVFALWLLKGSILITPLIHQDSSFCNF